MDVLRREKGLGVDEDEYPVVAGDVGGKAVPPTAEGAREGEESGAGEPGLHDNDNVGVGVK